jgi:hypothetical protein
VEDVEDHPEVETGEIQYEIYLFYPFCNLWANQLKSFEKASAKLKLIM